MSFALFKELASLGKFPTSDVRAESLSFETNATMSI